MIAGFSNEVAQVNGQNIAFSRAGSGPPVLLLHGFPQMRAMWHAIAPVLAQEFTVIAADLRGYGESSKPTGMKNYSFREMAADQVALMQHLGFEHFHLVGHDRGARTSHRLALDAPDSVVSLTVMDIVPTHLLFDELSKEVATGYYHWFFLAQPEPFPERLIGADPDYYYETCLAGWGPDGLAQFNADALNAYRTSWRDPHTIRAMCDDYRAALRVDFDLDAADLARRVACPALVMYGADGPMGRAYDVPGTWADRLADMRPAPISGGHFFPDTNPSETAAALLTFLRMQN